MEKTMSKAFVGALVLVLCLASTTWAAPIINVGTYNLLPDTPNQEIILTVTGTDLVAGFNLEAQIGSSIDPADQPVFQDISFTGGMWDAYANSTMGGIAPGAEQLAFVSVAFNGVNDKVAANGLLVKMTVSTVGITSGDYSLRLSNILDVIGEDSYFNAQDASPIAADITNGSIHITPEPATVTLLGLGALALLRRRKVA